MTMYMYVYLYVCSVDQPEFDLTTQADYTFSLELGYVPGTEGRDFDFYMNVFESDGVLGEKVPFMLPRTPLYQSKATCGLNRHTKVIDLETVGGDGDGDATRDPVVQIRLVNLGNMDAALELHGLPFYILGSGYDSALSPTWHDESRLVSSTEAPCNDPNFGVENPASELENSLWGCMYDEADDHDKLNYDDPIRSHHVIIPAHTWVVVQLLADNPGMWLFGATSDASQGQQLVFNTLPDAQVELSPAMKTCEDYECLTTDAASIENEIENNGAGALALTLGVLIGLVVVISTFVYFDIREKQEAFENLKQEEYGNSLSGDEEEREKFLDFNPSELIRY